MRWLTLGVIRHASFYILQIGLTISQADAFPKQTYSKRQGYALWVSAYVADFYVAPHVANQPLKQTIRQKHNCVFGQ